MGGETLGSARTPSAFYFRSPRSSSFPISKNATQTTVTPPLKPPSFHAIFSNLCSPFRIYPTRAFYKVRNHPRNTEITRRYVYDINMEYNPTAAPPEHRYPCLVIFADDSSFFTSPFWGGMGWGVGVGVALVA